MDKSAGVKINGTDLVNMEALVDLLTGRCAGAVNDDSVEDAVSQLLSRSKPARPVVVRDLGNYDDDDVDDDGEEEGDPIVQVEPQFQHERHRDPRQQFAGGEELHSSTDDAELDWETIPLGKIGARLMQTFGDGPKPRLDAVSACLLGTRDLLQTAIKDARALRRKMKLAVLRAKSHVTGRDHVKIYNRKKQNATVKSFALPDDHSSLAKNTVDAELLFRAFEGGHNTMSFDPPCGFDEEQLDKLFPEEMYAYRRWKCLHKAATDNNTVEKPVNIEAQDYEMNDDDVTIENDASTLDNKLPHDWGGYLHGRLAQFDARTEKMKDDWYIRFSEVRRGSFLPHTYSNQEERAWDKVRKESRTRGRINLMNSTWESLPAQHVQFLHWLGFQPRSSLPLPSETTTQALAFLAYDFYGKIVEKAIFLKCLKDSEAYQRHSTHDGRLILELGPNEQLTKRDIEASLNDSTVVAKPLYHAANSQLQNSQAAQLYFGPGFEERLEVELDQIILKKTREASISQEENNIRIQEDKFFDNLKRQQPVKLDSIMSLRSDVIGYVQKARSSDNQHPSTNDEKSSKKRKRSCKPIKGRPVKKSHVFMTTSLEEV